MTVGITFAVISKVESQGAREFKRSFQAPSIGGVGSVTLNPRELFNFAAVQLVFDTTRTNSAVRGHSLLRDMYGSPRALPLFDSDQNDADATVGGDGTPDSLADGADPEADAVVRVDNDGDGFFVYAPDTTHFPYRSAFNGPGLMQPRREQNDYTPITVIQIRDYLKFQKDSTVAVSGTAKFFGFDVSAPEFPLNFTEFDQYIGMPAGSSRDVFDPSGSREPEKYNAGAQLMPLDEDYDAPDFNNLYLALERADGQIVVPSFVRPQLTRQIELAGEFASDDYATQTTGGGGMASALRSAAWRDIDGRKVILRPRELEVNASVVFNDPTRGNRWRDLLDLDGSGVVGDSPEELDVDTDGDGLKDAIWVDLGHPPRQDPVSGRWFKPLFAFKVLDLDGKLNLNAHGRLFPQFLDLNGDGTVDTTVGGPDDLGHTELHVSHLGASPADVNLKHAMLLHHNLLDREAGLNSNSRLRQAEWRKEDPQQQQQGPIQYGQLFLSNGVVRGRYNPLAGAVDVVFDRPGLNNTDDNFSTGYYDWHYGRTAGAHVYSGIVDFLGSGRYYEPFINVAGLFSPDAQAVHARFFNYYRFGTNDWRVSQSPIDTSKGVFDATKPLSPIPPTINTRYQDHWLTWDEAEELDLYSTTNSNDSLFTVEEIEKLLRFSDIDSSALTNRLPALLPNLFGKPAIPSGLSPGLAVEEEYARQRMRRLFAHASWDLVRFNMPPNFTLSNDSTTVSEDADDLSPTFATRHFGVFPRSSTTIGTPQFAAGIVDELKMGLRIDLNRKLTNYEVNATVADTERSELARDLYIVLFMSNRPIAAGADRIANARTLAQIAVNIVDMRDTDDAMTILQFDDDPADGVWTPGTDEAHTVLGFEMPRLVLSEAVGVVHDDGAGGENVWLWAELNNPWPDGPTYPAGRVDLIDSTSMAERYRIGFTDGIGRGDTMTWVEFDMPSSQAPTNTTTVDALGGTRNYFLVGPPLTPTVGAPPPGGLLLGWDAVWNNGGGGTGGNDFTSDALLYHRTTATMAANFTIGLFRARNPYDPMVPPGTGNNYWVQIDHVRLETGAGGYLSSTMIDQRYSRVRQQPWHGENRPWDPQTTGLAMNEENKYLGPPLATTALAASGFLPSTNGNAHTLGVTPGTDDTVLYSVSFPFLNRDYASPLELLHLRLYGSHFWTGVSDGSGGTGQWRLRFTDDFEYNAANRVIRDRRVPWYEDNRALHPADAAGATLEPLPELFRFFEFVECHSRMNGATTPPAAGDPESGLTVTELVNRQRRVAGKINLNTITDEEVFRALFDEPEVMPVQQTNDTGVPQLASGQQQFRIPPQYYHATPNISDFDWRRNLTTGQLFTSQSTLGGTMPTEMIWFGSNPNDWPSASTNLDPRFIRRQWPGVLDLDTSNNLIIPDSSASAVPPGRYPYEQVHSEMYRMFLLSRAGRDGIYGTGDDKPFRSFAAPRLSDTILRRRDFSRLDFPEGEHVLANAGNPNNEGEYIQLDNPTDPTMAVGTGQWTPRLFDPVVNPLPGDSPERENAIRSVDGQANNAAQTGPFDLTGFPVPMAIDSWMLEHERNKLLAKIGGNVTTRSHVFAVWAMVGYFWIEPGTETAQVPCINEEIGIDTGTNIRHRAFFIVDRSLADRYDGPIIDDGVAPPAPGPVRPATTTEMRVFTLPGQIHIIE
jgi:hypothetical protein